ncbi:GatB/YqeY domain-containing protein [Candidatus Parcubacteria bacterium]|nr:GatB/YqeY domain-containing protein [Candidatus Parcubacteria bacterium]
MTQADIKAAMIAAMKAKEPTKVTVLRGIMSALMNEAVAKGKGPDGILSDDEILTVLTRAAKQRKDSIEQFEKGGRPELATGEKEELSIIETMLPTQMSQEEIVAKAKAKAAELGVTDKTKANQLMGMLMKDLKGRADGNAVKAVVDNLFN